MSARPPRIARWLLKRSGASEALIGDVEEMFESRRSRAWLWRQVLAALAVGARSIIVRDRLLSIRMAVAPAALGVMVYAVGCGPTHDAAALVRVEGFSSGWVETSDASGQTKVTPSVAFKLKNISDDSLRVVQVNAVFHRADEREEWGNAFHRSAGARLAAGATTDDVRLISQRGYVGTEEAAGLLANSKFVDAQVELYGKHGSTSWVKLGQYRVSRTLVTP